MAAVWISAGFVISACAPTVNLGTLGQEELVERSAKQRPDWITSAPEEPGFFFATGIATSSTSLEDGKVAAVQAAVQEIVNYLGIRAEVQFTETRTELATRLINRITSEGAARLSKGRPLELYYERYRVETLGPEKQRFEVHVLVRIPLKVLEEEAARLERERGARIRIAEGLLNDGHDRAGRGDLGAAIRRWLAASRLLEDEWGVENVQQQIRDALSDLASSVTLVALEPEPELEPEDRLDERAWAVKAFVRGDGEVIPLPWTQLEIEFSQGGTRSLESITTDESGVAQVTLPPRYSDAGRVGVRASIDVDRILGQGETGGGGGATAATGLATLEAVSLWLNRPWEPGPLPIVNTRPDPVSPPMRVWESLSDDAPPIRMTLESTRTRLAASRRGFGVEAGFLVDIRAGATFAVDRIPLNLVLVVDRSGSMQDEGKIEYVKEAVRLVVRNLGPADRLSIVLYSSKADVLISGGTLHDRQLIDHHLDMLQPKSMTNLSAGLLEGVNQAETYFLPEGFNRIVVLSDGLANKGVTNSRELEELMSELADENITLSTVGLGDEFDEELLIAMAESGQGNYYYVQNSEDLPDVLMEEMRGLMSAVAQNIAVVVIPGRGTEFIDSMGHSSDEEDGEFVFRLGDMVAGERNLLGFAVRLPRREPGMQEIGKVVLRYDGISGGLGRVEDSLPMRMEYTANRGPEDPGENITAIRYLQVLKTMDLMELAMQGADPESMMMITEFIDSSLDELLAWSETLDDPDMGALMPVFEDCVSEMSQGMNHSQNQNSPAAEELRRQIRAKLRSYQ